MFGSRLDPTEKSLPKRLHLLLTALTSALALALLLGTLGACGAGRADQNNTENKDKLLIVATVFAAFDFSRTIAGEVADVRLLAPPGVESHSFEPSPADMILLSTADVLLCAGGDSDAWIDKIIASLDNPNLLVIRMIDLVDTLEEYEPEYMTVGVHELPSGEHESDHGHEAQAHGSELDHEIDVHVWTSLRNAQVIVQCFADSFSNLDNSRERLYQENALALIEELASLDARISSLVAGAARTTIVFGDRFPFRYFVEDYNLNWYAAFPGCSTAVDTNPATMVYLISTVREQKIPFVFYLELSDQRIARTISEETGAGMLLFHSAHTISRDDFEAGVTYLDLMISNANNLEAALN
ncbi:MAG: metal ABC transporter substrate-binding protein [Coriobacteriia bacterium]|nr:metal ABC transporter substrate-binding protein [Coriobacteriia bacterium]MCL2750032.1 metal ABC transporter substrate-binding protein [Coriobacteriia bacterium]